MKTKIPALKFAGDMARAYPPHSVVFQHNFTAVYGPSFKKVQKSPKVSKHVSIAQTLTKKQPVGKTKSL